MKGVGHRSIAGIVLLATALSGCVVAQKVAEIRDDTLAVQESRFVKDTVVERLQVVGPHLRIGTPDCSMFRSSKPYFNICTLSVDGRSIQIGLRYDEDRRKTLATLLGVVINVRSEERVLSALALIQYDLRTSARCDGPTVQALPVGAALRCLLRSVNGSYYASGLRIVARLSPHEVFDPIPGLKVLPHIATLEARVQRSFQNNPRAVSGSAIAAFLNVGAMPYLRAVAPNARFGWVSCPRRLDVLDADLTNSESFTETCLLRSIFGYFRIAIFTSDGKRVAFQSLTRSYDLWALERLAKRQEERRLREGGSPLLASVDCGPQRFVALSLLSVYYCRMAFSNGREARVGIEYYDAFEGPQIVFDSPSGNRDQ